jgi:hypothetical protein
MALDLTPASWIADWSEDATDVTFPIASLPELTAAEADGTTGDIRKVYFALCSQMQSVWDATAAADRPVKMLLYHTASVSGDVITHTYTATFKNSITAQDVADE